MAVGHKMFLNPPPFTSLIYEGELDQVQNKLREEGESSGAVITYQYQVPFSAGVVTTEILFGTIATKVTTSAVIKNKASGSVMGNRKGDESNRK